MPQGRPFQYWSHGAADMGFPWATWVRRADAPVAEYHVRTAALVVLLAHEAAAPALCRARSS